MEGSQLSHSLAFAMNFRLLLPKHACRCSCFQPYHSSLQDRSWANSEKKSGARNSKSDRHIFFPTSLQVISPFFSGFRLFLLFCFLFSLFLPLFSFSPSISLLHFVFTFIANLHLYLSHLPSHNKQPLQDHYHV